MIDVEFRYNRYRKAAVSEQMEAYTHREVVSFFSDNAAKLAMDIARQDPTCVSVQVLSMASPC